MDDVTNGYLVFQTYLQLHDTMSGECPSDMSAREKKWYAAMVNAHENLAMIIQRSIEKNCG